MSRIGLHGKLTAIPGRRDALVDHLLHAAKLVEDAPGCELYFVSVSATDADAVWVTEVWRSAEDHQASLSRPGVRELIGQVMPMLAGPPERIDTVPIGGKGIAAT
jgi:quinol monooxygenase YgiN